MSAIVPPLDQIPKLPSTVVTAVIKQLDKQTDTLTQTITKAVQDSTKLPKNTNCNDPKMKQLKAQLEKVQEQITSIQETIPKVKDTAEALKQIVNISIGIKAVITAAQLSNPVTAAVFVATQSVLVQDATIVNAIESLKQFQQIPISLTSKIQAVIPPLMSALKRIETACGDDSDSLEIPENFLENSDFNTDDYNDLVETDFYNDDNVNSKDLSDRANLIQELLQEQRDLLKSLQEAPSQVLRGNGAPDVDLGKPGDYYIDSQTNAVYGPKVSYTSWT